MSNLIHTYRKAPDDNISKVRDNMVTPEKIQLFNEKRFRETHLRRSVVAIDDTDFLMQMRTARRQSIASMQNDDNALFQWKGRVWNNITESISPAGVSRNDNNDLASIKDRTASTSISECDDDDDEGGDRIVADTFLKSSVASLRGSETATAATADESLSSSSLSSSLHLDAKNTTRDSSSLRGSASELQRPAWYTRLAAISKWERTQEKAYHDTLDERHEANHSKHKQNHKPHFWQWQRQKDGLDFSRDVVLAAGRQESIYAFADSLTDLPSADGNENGGDGNHGENDISRNGNMAKTKKCVLDLIM